MATKWGIVGNGRICSDFATCLTNLPQDEHRIVAVAAPSLEEAEPFAKKYNIPKTYGSYQEIAKDPDVDIFYVGYLNNMHYSITKHLLEESRNVLCEKPICLNYEQTLEITTMAEKKKVFLMEAIWSRFFPAYEKTRSELAAGVVGRPAFVQANSGFNNRHFDRVRSKRHGGGAILDLGIYGVQLASMVFGGERPEKILTTGFLNEEAVDELGVATLIYSGERIANIVFSSRNHFCNEAFVSGPNGFLRLSAPFWCPTQLETPTETRTFPLPEVTGKTNYTNSEGLTYEANEVRRCLKQGLTQSPIMPLEETRTISFILTEVRRQLGVDVSGEGFSC